MIQRIQSVYLALIVLISLLLFKGNLLVFTENTGFVINVTFNGMFRDTNGQGIVMLERLLPLSVLIVLVPAVSLTTIFLFKKRMVQLLLVKFLIGLLSVFILGSSFYIYLIISKYSSEFVPGIKMAIPFILLILAILALRGIRKDDQLVKSYDRLR
jgi:hypothetical protein